MERNDSVEKFNRSKGTSNDQISGLGQAKSYACTFCKQGFSNAQALGGHMNIHRRDRARIIRQYSEDQNQGSSSDAVKCSSTSAHHDPLRADNSEDKTLLQLERKGTNMISRKPSCPSTTRSENHEIIVARSEGKISSSEDVQAQLQLPLFLEEPVVSHGGGKFVELDLELRLGPEPPQTNFST
ncbi:hypothetical protein ACLB2K_060436 [Fragaria x ananassa]